jgi:hypothetical protein
MNIRKIEQINCKVFAAGGERLYYFTNPYDFRNAALD